MPAGVAGGGLVVARGRDPPAAAACQALPDAGRGWGVVLCHRAWRLRPAPAVPAMVTTAETVSAISFTVHKIEPILRVEMRGSPCS